MPGIRKQNVAIIVVAVALSASVGAGAFWATTRFFVGQAERSARSLLLSHRGMHLYIQEVMHPALYALKARGEVSQKVYAPEIFSSSFIVREQHRLYNQVRRDQGLDPVYYKMAADNPRNPVNQADAREAALIATFNQHRDLKEIYEVVKKGSRPYLWIALPFLENAPPCLRCHGDRAEAPEQLQTLYPGAGGFNEKLGRIRAIESIGVPIDSETRWAWVAAAMLVTCVAVLVGLVRTNRWLSRRVEERTRNLALETAERRRAEEALQVTQFAVELMSDAVYRMDQKGKVVYANQAGVSRLGYTREEMLASITAFDINPHLTTEAWTSSVERLLAGESLMSEALHRRKDGTDLPVEFRASTVHFGGEVFIWSVVRDISDRKRLEGQLLQAQKMEAVATLAGGIAHDFNNILSGIRGYAELAVMDLPEDSQTRADLNQILQATLRARELVKQILALGRRDQRERTKVDVGAVVCEALKLLRPALPAAIEVHERIEPGLWVLADAAGVHQIVMNLATNAFQSMRQTSGVLDIEATGVVAQGPESPPGAAAAGWVRLRVRDTGTGIPAELLPRIFEPYFTTKEGHSGSGLGLSVVHGLAVGYGGVIRVDSQPGKGTCFDVWLPRCEGGQRVSSGSLPAQTDGEEGVLVVDDEADVRMVCVRMLGGMGYRVVAVSSASEALSRLQEQPDEFSVVLTDQNMPKTTGLELAARIRESHPRCRIVLMSGYSDAIVGRSPEDLGIDHFLSKPFTAQELSVAVRSPSDTVAS